MPVTLNSRVVRAVSTGYRVRAVSVSHWKTINLETAGFLAAMQLTLHAQTFPNLEVTLCGTVTISAKREKAFFPD